MTAIEDVEILLVEDNPNDVELTLRALQKQNLASKVFVVETAPKLSTSFSPQALMLVEKSTIGRKSFCSI